MIKYFGDSSAALQTIINSVYDAVILHDLEGTIMGVNSRMLEMYEISHELALTLSISKDYSGPNNNIDDLRDIWSKVIHGESILFEWEARRPLTHSLFEAEVYLCKIKLDGKEGILASVRDISERKKIERKMEGHEKKVVAGDKKFQKLVEATPDAMIIVDARGAIFMVNELATLLFGYEKEEWSGLVVEDLIPGRCVQHAQHRANFFAKPSIRRMGEGGESFGLHKDGHEFPAEISLSPIDYEDEIIVAVTIRDLTVRKNNEAQLRLWAEVLKNSGEGIVITDENTRIIQVNHAFTRLTGYSLEDVIGQKPSKFKSGRHDKEFYRNMWESLDKNGYWQGEIWDRRKDGTISPNWTTISQVKDNKQKITHYASASSDITAIKASEERIHYLAYYDSLTGLPNHVMLKEGILIAMEYARKNNEKIAILSISIDGLQIINDSLGHDAGDQLIIHVADCLKTVLRSADLLGRFSGDQFMVVLPVHEKFVYVVQVIQRIAKILERPINITGFTLNITGSIGICFYPDDSTEVGGLIQNAATAMDYARENGGNNYLFYREEFNIKATERLSMIHNLRHAVEQKEFILFYQPKVNSITGALTGVEALIRWNHPDRGLVSPLEFIDLLEETRLIIGVGVWILREACKQCYEWIQMGLPAIPISVNVSAVQLHHPEFPEMVEEALIGFENNRQCIEMEITEGVVLSDIENVISILQTLKKRGFKIALDDFGTGYSSLSYLRRLPIDIIKIDQSFVRTMNNTSTDMAIMKTIIALSKDLGLTTIAEGVETKEQLGLLRDLGCTEIQGYYFAKPMPGNVFVKWLKEYSGTTLH